jgi:hypothetical protein
MQLVTHVWVCGVHTQNQDIDEPFIIVSGHILVFKSVLVNSLVIHMLVSVCYNSDS